MIETSKVATASRDVVSAADAPERVSRSALRRLMATGVVLGSAGLALAGCGNSASPSPTESPSIVVSPQTSHASTPTAPVEVPEGTPELEGFDLLFAARYPGSAGKPAVPTFEPKDSDGGALTGLDGVLTDGVSVAVYRNDPVEMKYYLTGYEISNGEQDWSRSGDGWLACHEGSLVVCETLTYSQGTWVSQSPGMLNVDSGGMSSLDVGHAGTFAFVGSYDDVAYFLTWDGTRSIHMTGFDSSGAPVIDKNLKLEIPQANAAANIETWMSGGMAWVRVPGAQPGIYVSSTNLFTHADVATPCISAADGVLCTAGDDPFTMVAIDDRANEVWRRATSGVTIPNSAHTQAVLADIRDIFLDSDPTITHRPDPGVVPGPGDPTTPATAGAGSGHDASGVATKVVDKVLLKATENGAEKASRGVDSPSPTSQPEDLQNLELSLPETASEMYVVSTGEGIVFVTQSGTTLHLPERGQVELEDRAVESIDLTRDVSIIDVSIIATGSGEAGAVRVASSILLNGSGEVLAELSASRAAELLEASEHAGEQMVAHSFAWQGDNLVFRDDAAGIIAIYRQK